MSSWQTRKMQEEERPEESAVLYDFCPHCGKEIIPGKRFCTLCGEPIVPKVLPAPEAAEEQPTPEEPWVETPEERAASAVRMKKWNRRNTIMNAIFIPLIVILLITGYAYAVHEKKVEEEYQRRKAERVAAKKIEFQIMTEFTWLKNEELPEEQIYVTPDEMESHLYRDCKYLAKSNYYLCIDESYIPTEKPDYSGTGGKLTVIAYNKGGKHICEDCWARFKSTK